MICGDDRMNTKADWIEIERRVRAGESARAISRDLTAGGHKISHTAINKHCKRGGWKLPGNVDEITAAPEPATGAHQRPYTADTSGGSRVAPPQEIPTEKTPVETPQKKAKPRRRTLWALQRNGTARVVGFYDKGV